MQTSHLENKSLPAIILKWLLAILFILTFSNFIYRGFTTNDDLEYYLAFHSNKSVWEYSFDYAKDNGRFYFTFMQPLFNVIIPNLIPNPILSQILNLIIIFSSILFIGQILKKIFLSNIYQYVFILITLIFINIKSDNNAIISYPFYFTLSFSFFTFSLLSYINYSQIKTTKWLLSSIFFFTFALLFYENYLLYIPLYFFLAIFLNTSEDSIIKKIRSRKELLYFIAIAGVYIITYYIFKTFFAHAHYDGVTVSNNLNIFTIFKTITGITRGAYPLLNYFTSNGLYHNMSLNNYGHVQNIFTPIINIQTSWLVKGLVVSLVTYLLFTLTGIEKKSNLKYNRLSNILGLIVLIILIYLPQVLISLTVKYQLYAEMGMRSYVTTYFSTFPIYILLTIVFIYIYINLAKETYKKYFKYTMMIFFPFFSIITDYANHHASLDLKNIHKHFEAVNLLLQTNEINSVPANSVIIAPELYNNKTNMSYYNCCNFDWSNYFRTKLNKNISVLKNDSSIHLQEPIANIYYLSYSKNTRENDQFFTFSKIKKSEHLPVSYISDKVTLYAYSPSKDFSFHIDQNYTDLPAKTNTLFVNNNPIVSEKPSFNMHLIYNERSSFFIPIHITGNNLDVKSAIFYINTFDSNHPSIFL